MTVPAPSDIPSLETVVLPSRAVLRSWRDQTVPAREAALAEAVDLYDEAVQDGDPGFRDMALLGVIADAVQPLEDLAYLASSWDAPLRGFATYVRATTYSDRIPTNFWQEITKWPDPRLDVLAGFAVRDANTGAISSILELTGFQADLSEHQLAVLDRAQAVSRDRLRSWLSTLAKDWAQFAPYFRAFKHGGLALNRNDVTFVADAVTDVRDQADRLVPSIAVWRRRGRASEVQADENLDSTTTVAAASGSGRLAIDLIVGVLASRLAVIESVNIRADGTVAGLEPELQFPWSVWLAGDDLTRADWEQLGAGPRIRWIDPPAEIDESPSQPGNE